MHQLIQKFLRMIDFVHRYDNKNVGDYWCSPITYYNFENSNRYDIKKYVKKHIQSNNKVILGGGGLLGDNIFTPLIKKITNKPVTKIVWSAGDNSPNENLSLLLSQIKKFNLVGIRDYIKGYEDLWVPCVSCKSDLFDKYLNANVTEDFVYYIHKDRAVSQETLKKYPGKILTNQTIDFETVIKFLSSANTVYTNTYHGVYWAQLLKKQVVAQQWSTKFKYMKYVPRIVDSADWHSTNIKTETYDILNEYRNKNDIFFNKVLDVL